MKKVLIIGMTEGIGGVETFITNLKKHMSPEIHMDFLVHHDINERYLKDILSNDSKIFKVEGIKVNFGKYLKDIFSFFYLHRYDVVHINSCDATAFVYALPLLFDKKTKLIIHSHSSSTEQVFFHNIFRLFQNRRANVKWACSDVAYRFMFGDEEKKVIIHNGIDLDKYKFSKEIRNVKRKELGLSDEIILGSVARFTKEKNHEKIVDVFFEFNRLYENSKLLLIGTGPLQEKIKEKVEILGLSGRILFLNSRVDVAELLSVMDVFLLPSYFEGLPFVSLEAQACSTTILASTNVSREIAVTDLVHFVDLSESSALWAQEIKNIIIDKQINRESMVYHQEIGDAGFDITEVCKIIEKEYKKQVIL